MTALLTAVLLVQLAPLGVQATEAEETEETLPFIPVEMILEAGLGRHTPEETVPEETEPLLTELDVLPEGPWDSMPLYFQTDYPNVMYGSGTLKSSGCGIVSLAMVASYLTGFAYQPEDFARWFGGYNGNNVERLENASTKLKLPWRRARDWHDVCDEVRKGAVAIVLEDYHSPFTGGQHFIVVKGLTEDDRVLVNDSYEPNYEKWDLKEGFVRGFPHEAIYSGYSGAWIYDTNAMPENPEFYQPEDVPYAEPRYPDWELTAADWELLARVVWVEARGESFEGQQAVAEVIFNRMAMEKYPDTVREVVFAPDQFRSVPFLEDAEPIQTQYEAVQRALWGPYILQKDVTFFARHAENSRIWGKIGGHIFCYDE